LCNLARCVHLFEQQSSGLIVSCFQSCHAADGEMCDRLKHPRQSVCHLLYMQVELKIGAASHFGENPERTLRRTRATLLKQKQSGSRCAQLLGFSNRVVKVAVKVVADDD
jgi:hypothetical protein